MANRLDERRTGVSRIGRLDRTPAQRLLLQLPKHEDDALRFMSDPAIPFDDNFAVRDLRMTKVQEKSSVCFRGLPGARNFGTLAYLSTTRKQGFDSLSGSHLGHQ